MYPWQTPLSRGAASSKGARQASAAPPTKPPVKPLQTSRQKQRSSVFAAVLISQSRDDLLCSGRLWRRGPEWFYNSPAEHARKRWSLGWDPVTRAPSCSLPGSRCRAGVLGSSLGTLQPRGLALAAPSCFMRGCGGRSCRGRGPVALWASDFQDLIGGRAGQAWALAGPGPRRQKHLDCQWLRLLLPTFALPEEAGAECRIIYNVLSAGTMLCNLGRAQDL